MHCYFVWAYTLFGWNRFQICHICNAYKFIVDISLEFTIAVNLCDYVSAYISISISKKKMYSKNDEWILLLWLFSFGIKLNRVKPRESIAYFMVCMASKIALQTNNWRWRTFFLMTHLIFSRVARKYFGLFLFNCIVCNMLDICEYSNPQRRERDGVHTEEKKRKRREKSMFYKVEGRMFSMRYTVTI